MPEYENIDYSQVSAYDHALEDPKYYTQSLISITDKDRHVIPFIFNQAQNQYYSSRTRRDVILKPRQLGFCFDPSTRILTEKLEWCCIKDTKIGDRIIAIDENNGEWFKTKKGKRQYSRKMRTAIVEAKNIVYEDAIKLTMDDGRELILTPDHRMLSRLRKGDSSISFQDKYGTGDGSNVSTLWRQAKDFKIGDEIRYICKPWKGDGEDRWFGGIIDGEGGFRWGKGRSCEANASQAVGPLFDEMTSYVQRKNYNCAIDFDTRKQGKIDGKVLKRNKTLGRITFSRMDELFQLIGQTRPKRFIGKKWWEGRDLPGKKSGIGWAKVVKIELLPKQEMIDLQTSTKTFIAEGFVSHNSTLILALFLQDTIACPNTVSIIVCHTQKDSAALFERSRFMLESIPEPLRPRIKYSNRLELYFDKINSTLTIGSAETRDFGRGRTINNLHLSEVSSPSFTEDFLIGLLESVPRSGRIVMESTARGEGGPFYEYYIGAKNPFRPQRRVKNEYFAHYFVWHDHKEYRINDLSEGQKSEILATLDEEELSLIERFGLCVEQLAWRREKKFRMGAKFVQEYPEDDDEEVFLKSGSPVFDNVKLSKRDKELVEQFPAEIWLGGDLYIYKMAQPGARYVIGADPAEGDPHSDFSAAMVTRTFPLPMEQVGLLVGRWTPDIFSEKIWKLGRAYNNALLAVERNNHGHAVLLNLTNGIVRREKVAYPPYPNVYVGPDRKIGWLTSNLSKPQMIDLLDRAMRMDEIVLNSKRFIEQAKRFSYLAKMKIGGSQTPDDIVMAQAISLIASTGGEFNFDFA